MRLAPFVFIFIAILICAKPQDPKITARNAEYQQMVEDDKAEPEGKPITEMTVEETGWVRDWAIDEVNGKYYLSRRNTYFSTRRGTFRVLLCRKVKGFIKLGYAGLKDGYPYFYSAEELGERPHYIYLEKEW